MASRTLESIYESSVSNDFIQETIVDYADAFAKQSLNNFSEVVGREVDWINRFISNTAINNK